MAAADATEGGSKRQVVKEMWSSRTSDTASKATSAKAKRNSQFRIVPKRNSMLVPDAGYEKGWTKKQEERDNAAVEGEGWKSKAFSIVPSAAS